MLKLCVPLSTAVLLAACSSSSAMDAGGCPAATGTGTSHTTDVGVDTTWTAADSPHVITGGIKVAATARLSIEPCATVKLDDNAHLEVDGKLVAEGTAASPIMFVAKDSTKPWGYLQVVAPGTISLANATLMGGGNDPMVYGTLEATGVATMAAQPVLKVVNVTVVNSAAYGVSLRSGGAFTADSSGLEIRGSGKATMRINPRLATNIPMGNYINNGLDEIVVETEPMGDVTLEDVTFHNLGVPYQIGGEQTVGTMVVGGGATKATLTLEAGVTLKFLKANNAGLQIDKGTAATAATGVLVAQGSAAKPVVFTSAALTPAKGDWVGLSFGNKPDTNDKLDHVEVHYAGGASHQMGFHCTSAGPSTNEDAAITFYGPPPATAVTNSTITDSAGAGINLAYSGAAVDLSTGNTFTAITSCNVTTPKDANGMCSGAPACP